jgi:hypothetical protein
MEAGKRAQSWERCWTTLPKRKETATVSTLSVKQTGAKEPVETVEEKFQPLESVWRAETAYVSSSSDLVAHPEFWEIVDLGPAVIPLLLRELENHTGHWHRALRLITGGDPLPPAEIESTSGYGRAESASERRSLVTRSVRMPSQYRVCSVSSLSKRCPTGVLNTDSPLNNSPVCRQTSMLSAKSNGLAFDHIDSGLPVQSS